MFRVLELLEQNILRPIFFCFELQLLENFYNINMMMFMPI